MWPLKHNSDEMNGKEEEEDEEEGSVENEEMALPCWMTVLTRSMPFRWKRG